MAKKREKPEERKHAEEPVGESEQRFRRIFEEGPLGMAIAGLDYRFVKVNSRLCQMLVYTGQELIGLTIRDITHPEDIDTTVQLAEKVFRGEIPYYNIEKRYIKKNKEILWVAVTASFIRDQDGKPIYGLGMMEDITQRKRAEEKIRHRSKQLALINEVGQRIAPI